MLSSSVFASNLVVTLKGKLPNIVKHNITSHLGTLPENDLARSAFIYSARDKTQQALQALDADRDFLKAGGVMDDDMIDGYIELKMEEVERLNSTTHPVEFEMYYSC